MNRACSAKGSVHRLRPLPQAASRGQLLVTESVVSATSEALRSSSGPDGRHEGIVLWAGRRLEDSIVVCTCILPESDHTWGSVRVGYSAVGKAARLARRAGLVIVAQVHSHPGSDTRHSDGDDAMILLPFDRMYSLVVGQ